MKPPQLFHKLMHSIKLYSAKRCNQLLHLTGAFWEDESYDHLVRNPDELRRIISYTLDNPVKAGLCACRADWKWNYINPDYNDMMG